MDTYKAFCRNLLVYGRRAGHDLKLYNRNRAKNLSFAKQYFPVGTQAAAMFIVARLEAYCRGFTVDRTLFAKVAVHTFVGLEEGIWSDVKDARKFYCEQFGLDETFLHELHELIDNFVIQQITALRSEQDVQVS